MPGESPQRGDSAEVKETGRVEAFSDGLFAIVITLLAFNLTVPHVSDGPDSPGLLRALVDQWPVYIGLFVVISIFYKVLWRYVTPNKRLLRSDADPAAIAAMVSRK